MKDDVLETIGFEKLIKVRQFPTSGISRPLVGNLALAFQNNIREAEKALNNN